MARPRSEEKRLALLHAAAETIAAHGLASSPTSLIAKQAGVAEGTLFRYFATKDELWNELYVHIKQQMCDAVSASHRPSDPLKHRVEALWGTYIEWGLANPIASKAVNQLGVSSVITAETTATTDAMFPELGIAKAFSDNPAFAGVGDFAEAIFVALADTTMAYAGNDPSKASLYKASGFAALWRMVATD
ncbi:TetR/AcrR family transcriptional regulator [Xanthomonas euroxanthea]|uniref:TetR/AcrR family transcriptional regulator n=1 Tax=Xanthomonas euroxanthea TaxID=2259622 RepID=A0AA46HAL4_9XANT|nr:TetR/AcrR family transcriptional regulator [Xanthomonas euroxanthea]CAE1136301.1 TetR/AcrR family transcriptional regulator [Xanthomonas euroxanthea]SUZ28360.1 TetR/AcrR family transcriptional regulator [Xanthomonas euroxanthea]